MSRKPLRCAHCGAQFPRVACAGLFCGDDCKNDYAQAMEKIAEEMTVAGFTQHAETPNLWVKDGVAIGIEHVKTHGFIKAIHRHQSVVAEHTANGTI